jgi:flagellar biosynthesis anti-sigma factor FlgM
MAMNNIGRPSFVQPGALEQFRKQEATPTRDQASGADSKGSQIGQGQQAQDRAEISSHARRLEDLRRTMDQGRQALAEVPDVRQERVEEVRNRLASGHYQKAEVRQDTAQRLGAVLRRLDALIE